MNDSIYSIVARAFDTLLDVRNHHRDILVFKGDVKGKPLECYDIETHTIEIVKQYINGLLSEKYEKDPFDTGMKTVIKMMRGNEEYIAKLRKEINRDQELLNL